MISIIIPTLNEELVIAHTLEQIKSIMTMPHEIIVSDGKSTDKTLEIARKYADIVIEYEGSERQTIAMGRNAGAARASGEFLVFVDADITIPNPNILFAELLNIFAKEKTLSGLIIPIKPLPGSTTFFDRLGMGYFNISYYIFNNIFHIGNASGEFQMIPAKIFRQVGGYRKDLVSGEDNDMFRRLARVGRTRFASRYAVYHTCRRAHSRGWLHIIMKSLWSGIYVMIFNKSPYKEWTVIR